MTRTRSQVLIDALARNRKACHVSMETFAQRLVEHYHAKYAGMSGCIEFQIPRNNDLAEIYKAAKSNAKRITRWIDDGVVARIPADAEESWVDALDEPFQTECIAELAGRYGLLAVPHPKSKPDLATDLQAVGNITKQMGEVLEALGPMIADGQLAADDAERAPVAIRELDDVIAAATTLKHHILTKTGVSA